MRILILGAGSMANQHARHFQAIDGVELAGVADLSPERRKALCDGYNVERGFASIEEALDWGEFDAITNVTPDAVHHPTTMAALAAGKHVFCEKPLAVTFEDAEEMADTAEARGLVGMVNLTYRNVAQIHKARELVLEGAIGAVRHIEASYLQSWLTADTWGDWRTEPQWLWRLSTAHGSNGTLGDIGIHILDFAVYGAATGIDNVYCRLKTYPKAEGDRIGDYVLDANDSFAMSVEFSNGALGVVHASRWATGHLNELKLRIYGEKGGIEVQHRHDGSHLLTCLGENIDHQIWCEMPVEPVETNYQRFVEAVRAGKAVEPSFRHAAKLQKVLDLSSVAESARREVAVRGEDLASAAE